MSDGHLLDDECLEVRGIEDLPIDFIVKSSPGFSRSAWFLLIKYALSLCDYRQHRYYG